MDVKKTSYTLALHLSAIFLLLSHLVSSFVCFNHTHLKRKLFILETTAMNPQFHVQIPRTSSNKCHVVVSITQYYETNPIDPKKKRPLFAIGFAVYEVPHSMTRLTPHFVTEQVMIYVCKEAVRFKMRYFRNLWTSPIILWREKSWLSSLYLPESISLSLKPTFPTWTANSFSGCSRMNKAIYGKWTRTTWSYVTYLRNSWRNLRF